MLCFRLDASVGPRDSLISERPTREHASDIFIFDIRSTISLARGKGSGSLGWKWMVDCARARWRKRIVGPVSRLGLKARASSFPFVRKRASGIPGGDEQSVVLLEFLLIVWKNEDASVKARVRC